MIETELTLDITPALIRFKRLAGRFTNFKPVLGGRIDVAARRLIRRQFLSEGRAGAGGGGWEALTANYLKRRLLPERPILRQSDGLFEALTQKGHPDQELVLTKNRYALTISEDADTRARFVAHQLGLPGQNLPARQMIPDPVPKTFIDEVRRLAKSYVVEGKA